MAFSDDIRPLAIAHPHHDSPDHYSIRVEGSGEWRIVADVDPGDLIAELRRIAVATGVAWARVNVHRFTALGDGSTGICGLVERGQILAAIRPTTP